MFASDPLERALMQAAFVPVGELKRDVLPLFEQAFARGDWPLAYRFQLVANVCKQLQASQVPVFLSPWVVVCV